MKGIFLAHRPRSGAALAAAVGLSLLAGRVAQADAATQTQQAIQQVCGQAAASYEQMDLTGYMRMYDSSCHLFSVSGRSSDYRLILAGIAYSFTEPDKTRIAHIIVRSFRLQGGRAYVSIASVYEGSRPGYTFSHSLHEDTVWVQRPAGWRELISQITSDRTQFQRDAPTPLT